MNKFKRFLAVLLTLTMVLSVMPIAAFADRGDGGWGDGGDGVSDTDAFGWNIASSIASGGKATPFDTKAAYDAISGSVDVYIGQLSSSVTTPTEAAIDAAVAAGTLTEIPIGGYHNDHADDEDGQCALSDWTIGDVKEKGLIVVARNGLTFASTSICCNDVCGFSCKTAANGNAGDFNDAITNDETKILVITPTMLDGDDVFHKGRGNAWLMLALAGEAHYNLIYNVRVGVDGEYAVDKVVSLEAGETIDPYTASREGYVFSGWYEDKELTDPWENPGVMPSNNIVVYGQFLPAEYNLTYNVRVGVDGAYAVDKAETLKYGDSIESYAPEKAGYVFDGWYTDADLTIAWEQPATMPANDIVVYGRFLPTSGKYVVDFGLPVNVTLPGVDGNVLTYTPSAVLQAAESVNVNVTYRNGKVVPFTATFVPATTVYYEEGFASFTVGTWTGASTGNGTQTLQTATNNDGNYGYDAKYAAETGMSNGTQAVSTASGDKAELTFTGTGIDVYANCDSTTSTVAVLLYKADGSMIKMYQVDTSAVSGLTAATAGQNVTSYSLPIVSIQGLTHGTYKIVIQHTKAPGDTAEFRLDGFRVYNTMTDVSDYAADENAPQFLELRNAVLAGENITENSSSDPYNWAGSIIEQVYNAEGSLTGALVLSGNAAVDANDLLENGPKNELFLRKGESVSFTLSSGVTAQIGLKAVNGSVSYTVNNSTGTVTTSTDMFYLEGTNGKVTIVNNSDNLLSVTKLKLFGGTAATALEPVSEELVVHALQTMGIIELPEVVNPFFDVDEDSWFYEAVMWAIENGITEGVAPGMFNPNAACSRGQIVTFMYRSAGSPCVEGLKNPFVDVDESAYYYNAVLWAVSEGITNGVNADHFAPDSSCTRAQVVTFLWRANDCEAADVELPFTDVAEGEWYTEAIKWAVANEITNGISSDVFGVNNTCTRAQIVTFLYRAYLK